jgi:predicted 3-demethylubiquinone-9 3-methyltransferase (glyoxalase superfamily)
MMMGLVLRLVQYIYMQKIVPHLWFDKNVKEVVEWYVSIFPESKITHTSCITDTPSGDCDIVSFSLWGMDMMAIGAGPEFTLNPSISFMVNFDPSRDAAASDKLEQIWNVLVQDGTVLMPLQEYPFSKKYGWIQDKYGLSWQLILSDPQGELRPAIMPALLFVKHVCGRAKEAIDLYTTVFTESKKGIFAPYPEGSLPDKPGTTMFADFQLFGTWFVAMDSAADHKFAFNEAFSFIVNCQDQAEIDCYWEKLSAQPEAEQCGWIKDTFGVSWQIVPTRLHELMEQGDDVVSQRVTQAFLKMKKFDIAALEAAAHQS